MWVLIPVKPLRAAKRRLAPLLDPHERERLARAMLADVLAAATAAPGLAGIAVVTADPEAAALAREFGALAVPETEPRGIDAAIATGAEALRGRPATGALILPADLPQITPGAIGEAVALFASTPAVLVVAAQDGGTNLLGLSPPNAIPPRFGPDSFRRHVEEARRAGIEPLLPALDGLDFDIDRPEDLAAFAGRGSGTRTHRLLVELDIGARLVSPGGRPVPAKGALRAVEPAR